MRSLKVLLSRSRADGSTGDDGGRIFAAFVDVKKAFPTVRRRILWHKIARDYIGTDASTELSFYPRNFLRAFIASYENTTAAVRGVDGYSDILEFETGTREGGVFSPWLYLMFVADLITDIDKVQLEGRPIFFGGKAIRAFQFADDLVLLARPEADLNLLLSRWSAYCSLNHRETSQSKTVIAIFHCWC